MKSLTPTPTKYYSFCPFYEDVEDIEQPLVTSGYQSCTECDTECEGLLEYDREREDMNCVFVIMVLYVVLFWVLGGYLIYTRHSGS